jgi:Phosphodiester glycosidase
MRAWAIVCFAATATATAASAGEAPKWRAVADGVEYAALSASPRDVFHVVRVDAGKAHLRAVMASAHDKHPRTAAAWCDREKLVAAINLGMFLDDGVSNVGFARAGAHVNQKRWNGKYQSVLAFGPRRAGVAPAALVDLDAPGGRERLDDYDTVVQNLRLIRAPGAGTWGAQARRWSEAAVAIDRAGRVLFVFARAPHSMLEFNRALLALPLDVVAAMHVEGGPEASLSVRGAIKLDLMGSFETGFNENESVGEQWAIPNVLAVEAAK